MTARNWLRFSLILLASGLVLGQPSQMSGPMAGYIFDHAAGQLRPILGMPGAALIGDPLELGFDATAATVAPRQDTAFVAAGDRTFLFRLRAGAATEIIVNGLTSAPERVVFSPTGTAAALYARGSMQMIAGLPDSPAIAGSLDVSAAGVPDALALSDDATTVLLSSGGSVTLFRSGASVGQLTQTAGSALLAFAPGRLDAAVADLSGAGLVLFRDLSGAAQPQILAAPDDSIRSGSALAFSADGQRLLLASSAGHSVTAFDLSGGGRNVIACSCSPTALAPLGNVFRLNEAGSGPVWLLDDQPGAGRIVFVPPATDRDRRMPARTPLPRLPSRSLQTTAPGSRPQGPPSE